MKRCKKSDSLGEQLDRCEELLNTCKCEKKKAEEEAKKEAEEQAKIEAEAKKSSSSEESFTRADAKRMLKDTFGTNEYDESKDYDTTHESYYVLGDEPQYINGKKVYHVELWDYVAEDDWWMHQTYFISKDGLE